MVLGCAFDKTLCNFYGRRSSLDSRSEILGEESIGSVTGKTMNRNKEVDEIHVDLLEDERSSDIKQEIRDDDVSSICNFEISKLKKSKMCHCFILKALFSHENSLI